MNTLLLLLQSHWDIPSMAETTW